MDILKPGSDGRQESLSRRDDKTVATRKFSFVWTAYSQKISTTREWKLFHFLVVDFIVILLFQFFLSCSLSRFSCRCHSNLFLVSDFCLSQIGDRTASLSRFSCHCDKLEEWMNMATGQAFLSPVWTRLKRFKKWLDIPYIEGIP